MSEDMKVDNWPCGSKRSIEIRVRCEWNEEWINLSIDYFDVNQESDLYNKIVQMVRKVSEEFKTNQP